MTRVPSAATVLFVLMLALPVAAQASEPRADMTFVYREVDGDSLHAYAFLPPGHRGTDRVHAILLFHGGGWSAGAPEWTFPIARSFADSGLVAIAIQYRLSQGDVTPIDALADACAAFEWTRMHAAELGLSGRVAGYGVSAGGQLVAATATIGCSEDDRATNATRPDALLLWSPALDLTNDRWFTTKLHGRATAAELSPALHVGPSTPPTVIVQGERDTLTPLAGAKRYCDALTAIEGICDLHVYPGVGHLLTRNLTNQESNFDPDPQARADGIAQFHRFLRKLGFVDVANVPIPWQRRVGPLIQGNTEFALALYKQIAREEGDIAVSPLSVSVATAMLYAGAAGATATEIAAAAHFGLPQETLHKELAALVDDLEARVTEWAQLSFANGVWVDSRCRPLPAYTARLSEFYGATPETVDFAGAPLDATKRINSFVSERTNGMIPTVVTPAMFTDLTRLVLVNTVYLLAAWEHPFQQARTTKEPFHLPNGGNVSVDMMHREGFTGYYEDDSVQVLELPYQGSGLSMLLVLPAADHSLTDLEAGLTPALLSGWLQQLAGGSVEMAIPRFEIVDQIDLIPPLRSLGMKSAFESASADFSGMCEDSSVYVSDAFHHVRLGVTERGTEAAAATVYVMTRGSEIFVKAVTTFRADRPFIYIVRDMRRGTILFLGRVVDPTP